MTFTPISIKLTFTAKTNLFFYENVKSKASVLCFENGQNLQRIHDNHMIISRQNFNERKRHMTFGSKWRQYDWLVYANAFTKQIHRTALFVHKINVQIII